MEPLIALDVALGGVIRDSRGKLSQAEFGAKVGWVQKKVSLVEAGKQPVSFTEMDRIAAVLGKDPLEMIAEAYARYRRSISG